MSRMITLREMSTDQPAFRIKEVGQFLRRKIQPSYVLVRVVILMTCRVVPGGAGWCRVMPG
ncbi:hypothetical protein AC792_03915 [Arthrobacter sp. RIT-PI-e]|nr:hypothetical protein AC792_03915 [Arthrobacter sp. RIT-PI-e]